MELEAEQFYPIPQKNTSHKWLRVTPLYCLRGTPWADCTFFCTTLGIMGIRQGGLICCMHCSARRFGHFGTSSRRCRPPTIECLPTICLGFRMKTVLRLQRVRCVWQRAACHVAGGHFAGGYLVPSDQLPTTRLMLETGSDLQNVLTPILPRMSGMYHNADIDSKGAVTMMKLVTDMITMATMMTTLLLQ